ncbi:MAG: PQQ-like beta-propeller repeat protein, partial [Chloroflexota bacterium]|nr:PQQ-like beta-propeller repeat protein [Chloroflexota bacterium]
AAGGPGTTLPTPPAIAPTTTATVPRATATRIATATVTPTATATATATPVPHGLVYTGGLDVSGPALAQPALVDPATQRLLVISAGADGRGLLTAFDAASGQKGSETALNLSGLTLDTLAPVPVLLNSAAQRLYVVARGGRIATLDSSSLTLGPALSFEAPVERAFLSPDGLRIYGVQRAGTGGAPALRLLDTRTGAVRNLRVPTGWSADSAFLDGNTLYLTGRDGLLPFEAGNNAFGTPITLGWQPLFPLYDAGTRRLFAWRQPQSVPLQPELVALDLPTRAETGTLTRDGCPCPLAYNPALGDGRLYLAVPSAAGRVAAYGLAASFAIHDEVVLNTAPALGLLADPTTGRLYVQSRGPHALLVLHDYGPAERGKDLGQVEVK